MILIIDLEATCWNQRHHHQGENEIIEIGAVLMDGQGSTLGEMQHFVRPVRNPILSPFCKQLTSITQSEVAEAPPFPEVLETFQTQVESLAGRSLGAITFGSWGDYDRKQFMRDCEYHAVDYPFGPHRNLKQAFAEQHRIKPVGMHRALRILGLSLEGTHHRGIDDARNIAKIFRTLGETDRRMNA